MQPPPLTSNDKNFSHMLSSGHFWKVGLKLPKEKAKWHSGITQHVIYLMTSFQKRANVDHVVPPTSRKMCSKIEHIKH